MLQDTITMLTMLLSRHVCAGMMYLMHGSVKACEKFLLYGNTQLQPEPWIDESADGWETPSHPTKQY